MPESSADGVKFIRVRSQFYSFMNKICAKTQHRGPLSEHKVMLISDWTHPRSFT
jgi:hypothetical protein